MYKGRFVWVQPLAAEHVDGIVAAANPDRSTFEWIDVPTTSDDVQTLIADLQRQPEPVSSMTFVQGRITDGLIVGMTNFLNIERWNGPDKDPTCVEVGNSWLTPGALASPIDTESKLLLMTHAFEHWNVVRVQVRTDARNDRSRRALTRIGAQFEGVLRNAQPGAGDSGRGSPRDTAVFSVVASEWPNVKAGLVARVGAG